MNVEEHYSMLLGLTSPWTVVLVEMNMECLRIDVYVEWRGQQGRCPVCGEAATGYDHLPEQTWRHLDTMQFEIIVHCRLPRVQYTAHGVKTLKAPWGNGRGFTLAFEAFAIRLLQAAGSTEQARKCLERVVIFLVAM